MTPKLIMGAAALSLFPAMASAGDPAAGEAAFRQCQTCHYVQNDAGEMLAGRASQQGPNLYRISGRQAGTADFRYGNSIVEAGEKGLFWDEDSFVAYTANPNGFLREFLDDRRARGSMAFQLRDENAARNIYAYIATFGVTEAPATN